MKIRKWIVLLVVLTVVAVLGAACNRASRRETTAWTPAPVTGSPAFGTRAPAQATQPPQAVEPTEAPTERPLPTVARATAALVTATATRDPGLVIITEADVLRAVTSGATEESGATLENVGVEFTAAGTMILTADRVGYGFVNVQNMTLVGRLRAENGKLQLDTESVSPQGLVSGLIPTLANQALQQYTSRWYIEDVETTEGQIELHVR